MNLQNRTSLAITDLREKAIELTEEFDTKNKYGEHNYNKRLESFLKRRIGKVTDKVLIAQIFLSITSLKILPHFIHFNPVPAIKNGNYYDL